MRDYYNIANWSHKHNRDKKDVIADILQTVKDNPGINQSGISTFTHTNIHQLNYYLELCLNYKFIRKVTGNERKLKGNVKSIIFIEPKGLEYLKHWRNLEEILKI